MTDSRKAALPELGPHPRQRSGQRPRPARHSPDEDAVIRRFAVDAAQLMHDLHCQDVIIFDLRGLSDVTDYIIIASGTSDRQIRAVAQNVQDLARQYHMTRFGRDEDGAATWLVIDLVDVVAHLFEPTARAHYDLEMMWGDAPSVPWQRDRDE